MKRFCMAFRRKALAACLFALAFSLAGPATAQQPAAPKKMTSVEGISEYRLANGLRVLLYPDASSSRVTVNMTILVGSRHEGYGETGMAHLLEHMLFKGTPTHRDVPRALRDHGASFNGTTWTDRTNYFETMPASDRNLEFALKLEADRLVNSMIRREDLASEMTVVRNEFEAGENNALGILMQRMNSTAFEWHNYGKSTIGNRSDIERVPIDRLQAFYHKYYRPDNTVLILAGQFDEAKALGLVAKYFSPLKNPAGRVDPTYTEEPPQDGEREVTLRRVGKVGAVGALYHTPAAAHPDFAACEVLANLIDYEPGGRLYKALVLNKKATNVMSMAFGYHDPGTLLVLVQTETKDEPGLRSLRDSTVGVLEKLVDSKFTPEEVNRVKQKLLKQRERQMTDVNRVGVTLSDWAAKGDWRLFFLHRDRVEKVTPEDVARVARLYLQPSNRTAGLYIPTDRVERTPVPETPKVAGLVKDYKGKEAVVAGEAFDPTPENIEKRTRRLTLPSGIKAVLLPKKTRGNNVILQLTLDFGNEESLKGQTTAAEFLGDMLERGTKDLTRQQFDDERDKLKARINFSSGTGTLTVGVECKRKDLPAVLTLVGKALRHPAFPAEEFDVLKRQTLEQLQRSQTEPNALAIQAMRRKLSPYGKDHVRYTPTIAEEIERTQAVTVDQVKKLYEEQLSGKHGALVVVGDFDPEGTVKQVDELLRGWDSKVAYRRIPDRAFPEVKGERTSINTPDKKNAIYVAGLTFPLKDSHPDYPALEIGNYLLGGAPLSSRLSNRLRGKDGLSYGAGSQVRCDDRDPRAVFMAFAICNPTNMEKVDGGAAEVLAAFLKDGVEAKELSDGIKAFLEKRKNERGQDATVAGKLVRLMRTNRTFADEAELDRRISSLSPEQIRTVFRKYINPARLVIIRAGDFAKKGSEK
jgi:zinc protease